MASRSGDRVLLAGLSLNLVLLGVSTTLFGAGLPTIIRDYSWSYTQAGIVLAANSAGYVLSTFVCGLLLHRWGARGILLGTLLLESAGFLLFARSPSVAVNTALNLAIGLGQGGTEVVSNYAAVRLERGGRSRVMNLLHAAFCVGAVAGPLGVAALLQSRLGWQVVFPSMTVLLVVLAASFTLMRFDAVGVERAAGGGRIVMAAGRPGLLSLYALAILLYVGVELSVSNWSPEFLVRETGASRGYGASAVSFLWTGLLAGRLGISWLYRGSRQEGPLLVLSAASVAFLSLLLLARSPGAALVILVCLGLGLSGIYPLVMTLVGKSFRSPAALGMVATAGGAGSFSFPFLVAWIADGWGLRTGLGFCLLVAAGLFLCVLVIAAVGRRAWRELPPRG